MIRVDSIRKLREGDKVRTEDKEEGWWIEGEITNMGYTGYWIRVKKSNIKNWIKSSLFIQFAHGNTYLLPTKLQLFRGIHEIRRRESRNEDQACVRVRSA